MGPSHSAVASVLPDANRVELVGQVLELQKQDDAKKNLKTTKCRFFSRADISYLRPLRDEVEGSDLSTDPRQVVVAVRGRSFQLTTSQLGHFDPPNAIVELP